MENRYSLKSISQTRNIILGFATLFVALFHSQTMYIENIFPSEAVKNILLYIKNLGNVGVDIFLILSGVGLFYSFSKDSSIKSFYKKRAVRILPAVIIVAIIITAMKSGEGVGNFFERIFLISLFTKGDVDFWYFSLIILLYIMYPIFHKLIDRFGIKAVIGLIASVLIINFSLMYGDSETYNKIEIALTRIPVFIFGIWIGKKSKEDAKISKLWLILIFIVFAVINVLLYYKVFNKNYFIVRYLYGPYAITLVILLSYLFSLIKNKKVFTRFLIWIGTYSMEIYLLYEYLVKNCKNVFIYKDIYNITYHISVFVFTIILAIALKKVCAEITEKVLIEEKK